MTATKISICWQAILSMLPTHEVNEEYRNSLLAATDAATQVNMVAGALKNPAVNGIMGAAGAAEKLFGNKDEK